MPSPRFLPASIEETRRRADLPEGADIYEASDALPADTSAGEFSVASQLSRRSRRGGAPLPDTIA